MIRLTVLFVAVFFLSSCKEVLPDRPHIQPTNPTLMDTSYIDPLTSTAQQRTVLIEEFTGASCVNCPDGHAALKTVLMAYPGNVVSTGLHYGSLAAPVKSSDEDLRIGPAADIAAAFGVTAMPTALIDRTAKSGGNRVYTRGEWNAAVAARISVPVKINLVNSINYDPIEAKYKYDYQVKFLEDISAPVSYSIVLLEDGVKVTQKDGSLEIDDYEQEHVGRKFYTNSLGTALKMAVGSTKFEKGRTYRKQIYLDGLAPNWKADNMYVVMYITNETTKEVLQAATASLK